MSKETIGKFIPVLPSGQMQDNWWEESSPFTYNTGLISTYYGISDYNYREKFKIPKDFILFADSGGFQNMTLNSILSPEKVLQWQEKNADIGFTFDYPILENDSIETKRKKQIKTVEKAYLTLKEKKDIKLYAVIQGHSLIEQSFIINKYKEMGNFELFDGYAIGGLVPLSGKKMLLTQVLTIFMEQIKEYKKPVHFFGLSGKNTMPIINYLSKAYDIPITFDSSSAIYGMSNRRFWIDMYNRDILKLSNRNDTLIQELPCDCPVCKKFTINDFCENERLIGLHNLYKIIKYQKILRILSKDIEAYKSFCKDKKQYFSFIDEVRKNGLEETLNIHYGHFNKHKTKSLKEFFI